MRIKMLGQTFVAAICALCTLGGPVVGAPLFQPVNPEIKHQYTGGWEHFVGGGVAIFDCNGDGFPELFLAGGESPSVLLKNQSSTENPKLNFKPDTPEALHLTGLTGAYPIDIDSDGNSDLVLLRAGENLLLKGDGACGFRHFDTLEFDSNIAWTTSFSATWGQGQSLPTMAFGNYVDRDDPKGPFGTCDDNQLYRPKPNGQYGAPTRLSPGFCALSMLFTDWNRVGAADLRVSNDRHYYVRGGGEQLWALDTEPRLYTEKDGWVAHQIWGMGIASRDITGDGVAEVYLTSMGDQHLHSRATDAAGPTYNNARFEHGISAHRPFVGGDGRPSTGWHAAFGDVQNDGYDDIFVAKGNVDQMMGAAMQDPNNLLLAVPNPSAKGALFSEFAQQAGVATTARSRGAGLVDLNRDGLLDLVVLNRRAPVEIYQNVSTDTGNWICIELAQMAPNVNAIGGFIELQPVYGNALLQTRELTIGGGHAGGALSPQHFGLGSAEQIRLRVIWPDGQISPWKDAVVNQHLLLRRIGDDFSIVPMP